MSYSLLREGMDARTLVDRLANDPDAVLRLNSPWRTFKGTPGTPNKYCLSEELLSLLLLSPLLSLLSS